MGLVIFIPGRDARGWRGKGGVTAFTLVALPVFLVLLGLIGDAGYLFYYRTYLQSAVDAAALSGVQELDFDLLAREGERRLLPEAGEEAVRILRLNVREGELKRWRTLVLNASPRHPLPHPVTGRMLRDPTLYLEAEAEVVLPWSRRRVGIRARADASILPREKP